MEGFQDNDRRPIIDRGAVAMGWPWSIAAVTGVYVAVAFATSSIATLGPFQNAVVWPAAGVALAALLIHGIRCWPGIFVGAFMAYFYLWFDMRWDDVAAALVLGASATLQAVLAAVLTRRLFRSSTPLARDADVLRFLALGGPAATLVAGALAGGGLVMVGALASVELATWWLTWWAGNAIGVLLFAPIVLILWPSPLPLRQLWGFRVAGPLLILAGLLAVGDLGLGRLEESEARAASERRMAVVHDLGFVRLPEAITTLASVGRLFSASDYVDRDEFEDFARHTLAWPGLYAVEWVPRVPAGDRAAFEAKAQDYGYPDYAISERTGDGSRTSAKDRDVYFPGFYVVPVEGNESTIGLDFATLPERRAAMDRARDLNEPRAAEPVPLVQTGTLGFPVFVPVYRKGFDAQGAGEGERQDALSGFVLGVFDIELLFDPLAQAANARGLAYGVLDVTAGYDNRAIAGAWPDGAEADWSREIVFAGRSLRLNLIEIQPIWAPGASFQSRAFLLFAMAAAFLVGLAALGAAGRYVSTAQEVTLRTADLRAREEDLDVTLNSIGDAVLATDVDGRVVRLNPVAEALTGWSASEAMGRNVAEVFVIINEHTRAPATIPVDEVVRTGRVQGLANHTVLIARDGQERAIADSAAPIHGPEGALRGVVLVFRDVDDDRVAERTLEESERRYREFIELAPCGVFVQSEGRFAFLNARAVEMLGARTADALLGLSVLDFLHPDSREAVRDRIRQLNEEDAPAPPLEEVWLRVDGSTFDGEATAVPYRYRDRPGALVMLQDISERKRADAERARWLREVSMAREEADRANQAKSAFLAAMSHEIRTPMNGVLGMAEVLAHSRLSEHQADLVRTIRESAGTLLRIIDDILDFSKIEAGRLELERAPVALADLVEGLCSSMVPVAARKHVDLDLFVDPSLPKQVVGDEVRLRQIVYNLVGNAIKFSSGDKHRSGWVSVRVETVPADEPGQLNILFRVADNGVGMSAETMGNLFEAFAQAEASTTRRFGGTGLGLAICRRLVDLMGGRIDVESTLGHGSAFTVTIPFESLPESDPRISAPLGGLRCIVVEKDRFPARDIAVYLENAGAAVAIAPDLQDALRAAGTGLTVVVQDIGHGRMSESLAVSSAESTPNVRHLLVARGRRRRIRVQAPNVVVLDGDALRRRSLLRAVEVAAGRASPDLAPEPVSSDVATDGAWPLAMGMNETDSGRLVLVAEDDDINQKVILQQLSLLGLSAETAGNGIEAFNLWRSGRFGLVITDLHMPEMDGYTLTESIRRMEGEGARIPILALTANALRGEEVRARTFGVDEYLTKPVPLSQLREVLARMLGGAREVRGTADSRGPEDGGHPVLDVKELERYVGADATVQHEFLKDFREAMTSLGPKIEEAVASGRLTDASAVAHQLKASSRAVGARRLADLCATIEAAGKGQHAASALSAAAQLPEAMAAVDRAVSIHLDGERS